MKTYVSPMLWFDLCVGLEDLLTTSKPVEFAVGEVGYIVDEMDF